MEIGQEKEVKEKESGRDRERKREGYLHKGLGGDIKTGKIEVGEIESVSEIEEEWGRFKQGKIDRMRDRERGE